jgi:hypothetical protein
MMRIAVISGVFVVVAWGFLIEQTANAQQPPAAAENGAAEPVEAPNEAVPLPPNIYPYPTESHPPVFVTEVYRHGRHTSSRHLNVFIYGMKPDVWQLLHCYQPSCSSSCGGLCSHQYGYGGRRGLTPVDPRSDDVAPLPPLPPIGVDPEPAASDPFQDDTP